MSVFDQLRSSLPSLEQIGRGASALLPRLAAALMVLLVGWIVARLLASAVRALVARLGHMILERRPTAERTDFLEGHGAQLIGKAVFWGAFFIAAMFATETLGLPVVTTWLAAVTAFLPRILLGLTVVVAAVVAGRMVETLVGRAAASLGARGPGTIGRLARLTLLVLGCLIALQQLGVDVSFVTTAFFIVIGGMALGAALAFGLGSQSVVSNILAMHYVRRSLRAGDRVRVGEVSGTLLRTTPVGVVLDTDAGEVTIPARDFLGQVIHRNPTRDEP